MIITKKVATELARDAIGIKANALPTPLCWAYTGRF